MSPLSERVAVLAVQVDESAHAPVRAALKAIAGTAYAIDWVTGPRAALAALKQRRHDAYLVDRDLGDASQPGLELARQILARASHAPVILLDDRADRELDLAATAAGVADYLVRPSPATLERSLRYAITHQRTLRRLAESEERYALALRGTDDGLWDWDVRADRLFLSPRWKAMLGFPEHEIGDAPGEWLGRVHPDDRAAVTQALESHVSGATQQFEAEHRIQHRDGGYRWMLARGTAVRDPSGRATRVAGSQTDVTVRRQAEQRLLHDALHDRLTSLANRALFHDRLAQAIRRCERKQPSTCAAVLFADLDRFKLVNDTLGHEVGDRLLIAVARRLESALRPGDTVGRLGGDEFLILLEEVSGAREATVIAERIHRTLEEPFHLEGRELVVAASIGIALAGRDAEPGDVVRDADVAMYRAKAEGKGGHAVFDAEMHEQVMRRLDTEAALRRAIEAGAIEVRYQPIVRTATGHLVGFEALARWTTADGTPVDPVDFVPIAEETGLIVPLGRHVLETACRALADWRALPHGEALTIGVNVSHRQLSEPDFATDLEAVLEATGLDAGALRLEISERGLSDGGDATRHTVTQVFDTLRVRWQIDDFGSGASALRLLHGFPGNAVKVFGPLVGGMGDDDGSPEIVRAIVDLAHTLGLAVIAEGVETAEQLDRLRALGCEYAQGFHFAVPMTADDARVLVEQAALTAS